MFHSLTYLKEGIIDMSAKKRKILIKIADFDYLNSQIACFQYDIIQPRYFFDRCRILKYIVKYRIESILTERELKQLSKKYGISIDKCVKSTFDYGRNKGFVYAAYNIRAD